MTIPEALRAVREIPQLRADLQRQQQLINGLATVCQLLTQAVAEHAPEGAEAAHRARQQLAEIRDAAADVRGRQGAAK